MKLPLEVRAVLIVMALFAAAVVIGRLLNV